MSFRDGSMRVNDSRSINVSGVIIGSLYVGYNAPKCVIMRTVTMSASVYDFEHLESLG